MSCVAREILFLHFSFDHYWAYNDLLLIEEASLQMKISFKIKFAESIFFHFKLICWLRKTSTINLKAIYILTIPFIHVGRYVFRCRTDLFIFAFVHIAYMSSLHIVDYVEYLSEYCPKHLRKLSGRVDK